MSPRPLPSTLRETWRRFLSSETLVDQGFHSIPEASGTTFPYWMLQLASKISLEVLEFSGLLPIHENILS